MTVVRVLLIDGPDLFPFNLVRKLLKPANIEFDIKRFKVAEVHPQDAPRINANVCAAILDTESHNQDLVVIGHLGGRGAIIAQFMAQRNFSVNQVLLVHGRDSNLDTYPDHFTHRALRTQGAAAELAKMIRILELV